MSRVWLIGGTQESAAIAQQLVNGDRPVPCLISVTTEAARSLYPSHPLLTVWVGRLRADQFDPFLRTHQIAAILDASHPFAEAVSTGAIAAAQRSQISYLRYERPTLAQSRSAQTPEWVQTLTLDQLLHVEPHQLARQRILLTLGYRLLPRFAPWHSHCALYARILPSAVALAAALEAGFTPSRIIALRPPISPQLEAALWEHWQISMVIAKASGVPGGEAVKRQLAQTLGVRLLLLRRPAVDYPQVTSCLSTAVKFCQLGSAKAV